MDEILTRLPGIRRGKFKKILATPAELTAEAPLLAERLAPLRALRLQGLIPASLYAVLWTLHYLRVRHPRGWWGAHRRDALMPDTLPIPWSQIVTFAWSAEEQELLTRYPTVGALLNHRAFRATPEAVHRSLLGWAAGTYPLVLMERVPTVAEVLAQQIQGSRCVTLFHEAPQLARMVLGERDPLSFAFHDLIHADHFFHANAHRQGQIGFYRQIDRLHRQGLLDPWLAMDKYPEQLEYLMADMNSHPLHLWKCFKAICHMQRREETRQLFEETLPHFLQLGPQESQALRLMNTADFVIAQEGVWLTQWCERWGNQ